MSTVTEQANILADLYRHKAQLSIDLEHFTADLAARQLAITPADGWPGKNEEQRRTARDLAYAADEACQMIGKQIKDIRDMLTDCEAEISAHQELASAARWEIRAALAKVMQPIVDVVEDKSPAAPEFDKALQAAVDEGLPF